MSRYRHTCTIHLTSLSLGNPLEERCSAENTWRDEVTKRLPKLKKLDGNSLFKKLLISCIIQFSFVGVPIVRQEEGED